MGAKRDQSGEGAGGTYSATTSPPTERPALWRFFIDRGGTFTDIVALRPDGSLAVIKVLSDNPEAYADAALQGMHDLLGVASSEPIPLGVIDELRMGTTLATNALLEHKGEPTLLLITAGFADLLRIGYQERPDIFARQIVLPELLHARVAEVPERLDAAGHVVLPLDLEAARRALCEAFAEGLRAVAIAFVHGYRFPDHESQVAALARNLGFTQVSASHEVSPLIKLVARGETTVADAYLSPVLRRYLEGFAEALPGAHLQLMQSSGGLVEGRLLHGKDAILSGPAGGVIGAVRTAAAAGLEKIITFDMGGTSTDVAHFCGTFERSLETTVGGVRLRTPMLRIHTVAAGGGSICRLVDDRFRVGPQSAGADPGPASYRRGGPLTVTDCNVMVGKLQPRFFPSVFGAGGDEPLDAAAVKERLQAVATDLAEAGAATLSLEAIADGFIRVAVDNMARAIRRISTQRGYDLAGYTLCSFGGAGGQHACLVADALGIESVLLHPLAGVLSAYGMGLAEVRALRERTVEAPLDDAGRKGEIDAILGELAEEALGMLTRQGFTAASVQRRAHLKYEGTDTALQLAWGDASVVRQTFEESHRERYGFVMSGRRLVVETLEVEAVGSDSGVPLEPTGADDRPDVRPTRPAVAREAQPSEHARVRLFTAGRGYDAPVFERADLSPGDRITGPAIIVEATGTNVVEPGWRAELHAAGRLLLRRIAPRPHPPADSKRDPVLLEVFNNRFQSIAEQMGATLANTAYSVNIKERLDFSCALFDEAGRLVANAPHIPVHLGSMDAAVMAVIASRGQTMRPGQVYLTNSPYRGGTHLPDLTVVTPVFARKARAGARPLFFVASRGHHADVGGTSPGSVPADSRTIAEEGVLIDDFLLVDKGRLREGPLIELLRRGPYPARNPEQNVADLTAQVAANAKGIAELHGLLDECGLAVVAAYMGHVRDNAAEAVRDLLGTLPEGSFCCALDDGDKICVSVHIDRLRRGALIDFAGTSAQRPDNFNAPLAVSRAAVLYVVRTLVERDIPLNAGCLEPLEIRVPSGCLLDPQPPAAVVAGNVEVSQLVVDALFGAFGALAASQGTMNNLTFGDEQLQYYETICGGAGAGPDFDGCSAVQTHMTNSRLTDPEVLECRFPVRVEEFAIRRGSGGGGRWAGGDGVVRRLRFLAPMTAALVSGRRRVAPFGLAGGGVAAPGASLLEGADGTVTHLPGVFRVELSEGDALIVKTPGGGGFGSKPSG